MSAIKQRLVGVARLEWRRQLAPGRTLWILLLALAPIAMMALRAWIIIKFAEDRHELDENFGNFYFSMMVTVVLFFGSATIFLGQIRGELDQRSWHYSLLTPIARWELVLGKYLAGLAIAWVCFVSSTAVSRVLFEVPNGLSGFSGSVLRTELLSYMAMTALCCCAYGSFFLAVGTLLRGPGYFVALFFGFEMFQFFLPPLLKQLSVVHYLRELSPVPISDGPFALLAEPSPTWAIVLRLLIYSAIGVALAAWKVSRSELDYRTK